MTNYSRIPPEQIANAIKKHDVYIYALNTYNKKMLASDNAAALFLYNLIELIIKWRPAGIPI